MLVTKQAILISLLLCSVAQASESVIVLQDNSVIRTKHIYDRPGSPQFEVEEVEIKDPSGDASCFDNAKKLANRRDRFTAIERCLNGGSR